MADREGGGSKILRGMLIALVVVALLVLAVAFRSDVVDGLHRLWDFVSGKFPGSTAQQVTIIVYMIVAVLLSVLFSKAGHFTAYGVAMALVPLLWFLFWEGFPSLNLNPTWTSSLGVGHLAPSDVILWAIVADVLITIVFVPLELWEKMRRRKHRLGEDND
jgi:hypothetical protein